VFSTLRCCGWAHGCIIIAVLHVQVGGDFGENRIWPSLYDVVVSWLRLKTPIDSIPHPYWMYKKCFSTLRYAVDGLMGAPLCCTITCAGGGEFQEKWGMAEPV